MINPALANAAVSGLIAYYAITDRNPGPVGSVILTASAMAAFLAALSDWQREGLTPLAGNAYNRPRSRSLAFPARYSPANGTGPGNGAVALLPPPK